MNLDFYDLLNPVIKRFNKEVEKLQNFLREKITNQDVIMVPVLDDYGAVKNLTLSSKKSNSLTAEIKISMVGNRIHVLCFEKNEVVYESSEVFLFDPSSFYEQIEKLNTFFGKA